MKQLSVIIPTYNRGAFLAPCVASVRECGIDAEIIIVDDGSTDDTPERVRALGDVIYVRQPNAGPATARNSGAAHATAGLLAFLDSDDTWRCGVVARLLAALDARPEIDVAYADAWIGSPGDGWATSLLTTLGRNEFDAIPSDILQPKVRLLDRAAFFRRMLRRNQVFLGSTVIRRAAFVELGGFDPQLFGGEDYEFVLRLAHRGRFVFLDEPLACYLKHAESISTQFDHMNRQFALVMLKLMQSCNLSPEEREMVRQRRREMMFCLAYNSYDAGDLPAARAHLRELRREFGTDAMTLALTAKCQFPPAIVRSLRRLKRSFTGEAP